MSTFPYLLEDMLIDSSLSLLETPDLAPISEQGRRPLTLAEGVSVAKVNSEGVGGVLANETAFLRLQKIAVAERGKREVETPRAGDEDELL